MSDTLAPPELAYYLVSQREAQLAGHAHQLFVNHLARTYGLKDGDRIEDDGRIVRANAPPAERKHA